MLRRASRGSGAASTVGSFAFCQAGQLQYQLPSYPKQRIGALVALLAVFGFLGSLSLTR